MTFAGCPKAYHGRAIVGFMAFDMLAGFAGASLDVAVPATATIPALSLAVVALICARRWNPLYLAIPILLSIDSLAMGAADTSVSLWSLTVDGLWSGTLAWAGFALAGWTLRSLTQITYKEKSHGCSHPLV